MTPLPPPHDYAPKRRARASTPRYHLSAAARAEIRGWWATGEVSLTALANEYGVGRQRIWQIVSREQETANEEKR